MKKETKVEFDNRFAEEMIETTKAMHCLSAMNDADYKLTMRDLNRAPGAKSLLPLSDSDIKSSVKNPI